MKRVFFSEEPVVAQVKEAVMNLGFTTRYKAMDVSSADDAEMVIVSSLEKYLELRKETGEKRKFVFISEEQTNIFPGTCLTPQTCAAKLIVTLLY